MDAATADAPDRLLTESAASRRPSREPVPSRISHFALRLPPFAWLFLITLLAALLRFISIDQPALWGDEAFTFSRICGTYRQMLGILQTDGFMPLHYSLYWWIGQQTDLSPAMMRLPVALAGTLMPLAMYFLARQLRFPTNTALTVALFAACSAYLLTYSRDAKMYMPFWLATTLHAACFFWWMRGATTKPDVARAYAPPTIVRAWCWLAAGLCMVGYHATGLILLGLETLVVIWVGWAPILRGLVTILLLPHALLSPVLRLVRLHALADRARWHRSMRSVTQSNRAPFVLPFLCGSAVIAGAVALYFAQFTRWDDRLEDDWGASGLQWVEGYNAERDGGDLLKFTATAFAFSWEWPNRSKVLGVDPRALKLLMGASLVMAGLAVLGVFTGRARVHTVCFRSLAAPLMLAIWLCLPAYVAYCRSIQPFASPWALLAELPAAVRAAPWLSATLLLGSLLALWKSGDNWPDRARAMLRGVIVCGATLGLMCIAYLILEQRWELAKAARESWRSVWMPRYLGFAFPAFAIVLIALLLRLPTKPLRFGAVALLLGVNLTQFAVRVWGGSEPVTHRLAADIATAQPLYVRQQQLSLDLIRQTVAALQSRPTRFARLREQVRKLPLIEPDLRVYAQTGAWSPEPGGGVIGSFAARYYLAWRVGVETNPREFRRFRGVVDRQWTFPIGLNPRPIAAELNKDLRFRRLVTWDRIDPGKRDVNFDDPVIKALGSNWRRISSDNFSARDHWTWRNLYTLRRREYVRINDNIAPPPTTKQAPTTRATTKAAPAIRPRPSSTAPTTRPKSAASAPASRPSTAAARIP